MRKSSARPTTPIVILVLFCLASATAHADDLIVYPKADQDEAQVAKDKSECTTWATDQTGFDPASPPPPPTAEAPPERDGKAVRKAARGAALGAAIGAAAGDAGEGAAIGAGVGGARDVGQQRRATRETAAHNQAALEAYQKDLVDEQARHRKAMTACLEGRDYSVE